MANLMYITSTLRFFKIGPWATVEARIGRRWHVIGRARVTELTGTAATKSPRDGADSHTTMTQARAHFAARTGAVLVGV